jgi:hypothetical protein
MSLLDSFITLLFLSSMLLFIVFMCRDLISRGRGIHLMKPRSFSPVFPRVSQKSDKSAKDTTVETGEENQASVKN